MLFSIAYRYPSNPPVDISTCLQSPCNSFKRPFKPLCTSLTFFVQEKTRLEAHFRAELLRVETLVAEARKHARLVTINTMQTETITVATTAEDGEKYDRRDERKAVSVGSPISHCHNDDNNNSNNNNNASLRVLAQNTREQGLASTRARDNERRVAQLERQLYVSEQQTKALEQGLEKQGMRIECYAS